MLRDTIIGLDFSGSVNAGEKIWVALARVQQDKLRFEMLQRAADLPTGGVERDAALTATVAFLQQHPNAVLGADFPFALTSSALGDLTWVEWLLKEVPEFSDADTFRAAYPEEKRATDIEAKTPFAPLNLRLYRQTFYGLTRVIAPLVDAGATAVPFMVPGDQELILMEVCPASLLKREKLYLSYKGKSHEQLENRRIILTEMALRMPSQIPEPIQELALSDSEGDALDAILCAMTVMRNWANSNALLARSDQERAEGRVFF